MKKTVSNVGHYRKLIAAIIGVLVIIVSRNTGIELGPYEQMLTDLVLGAITVFGVWFAPNDAASTATVDSAVDAQDTNS